MGLCLNGLKFDPKKKKLQTFLLLQMCPVNRLFCMYFTLLHTFWLDSTWTPDGLHLQYNQSYIFHGHPPGVHPESYQNMWRSVKSSLLPLWQPHKAKESFVEEANSLHIPSITACNSLTSCLNIIGSTSYSWFVLY